MAKASSMVESARPSSSKTADAVKTVIRTRAAELSRRGEGMSVLTAQSSAAREKKLAASNPKNKKDQSDQQAGQENEKASHVFLHAQDAERAYAQQNKTQPGGPESEAADQFGGGRQRRLVEQLSGAGALGKLVELDETQEAAQNPFDQVGDHPAYKHDDQHHQQARQEAREFAHQFLRGLGQFIHDHFPHGDLTSFRSTVPAGTASDVRMSGKSFRCSVPLARLRLRGFRPER